MATMILSTAGAELGNMLHIPGGGALGRRLGGYVGRMLERSARGDGASVETFFTDALLQRSVYGRVIPTLYGTMRMAGNVIWSGQVREVISSSRSGGGKGTAASLISSARGTKTTVKRRYVSFAVALCGGPGVRLERAYADDVPLDLSGITFRFYPGDETQLPDPLIEADTGVGACPAFRGICYAVFEDFPLEAFGNRVPNIVFELTRLPQGSESESDAPEQTVKGICLIPGAGEYVYDTVAQTRLAVLKASGNTLPLDNGALINRHSASASSDLIASLDQLQACFPNLEDVALVVTWFGTSVNAGECVIRPCVEYSDVAWDVSPDPWSCAGYTRATAPVIGSDGGLLRYGGTPSDASVLRCMAAIKARGWNVTLYPMIFMDVPDKPWRGRITGTPAQTAAFFTKTQGFNEFVLHYAALAGQGGAEAFIIGSEMKGLTSVRDGENFPAVTALIALAAQARTAAGSGVKLGYAADWSEYHHTDGGRYHLDPLFASTNIDFVGIDAYFPLTDKPESETTLQDVVQGWTSGEGYSFYYTDEARTTTAPLAPAYAWKNISWWWNNVHYNPGGAATEWVPASKPIRFTEVGYPSVDGASNRPNVFYDPSSSESALPFRSSGLTDMGAQRRALQAMEIVWGGSAMVEKRYVWAWDARPFPLWPDRSDLWADYRLWEKGHWVQGKLGGARVSAVANELLRESGFDDAETDMTALDGLKVDGLLLDRAVSAGETLSMLEEVYGFRLASSGGVLRATLRGLEARPVSADLAAYALRHGADGGMKRTRKGGGGPASVRLTFADRTRAYGANVRVARAQEALFGPEESAGAPVALTASAAERAAERLLRERRAAADILEWTVPLKGEALMLERGDVVTAEGRQVVITSLDRSGGLLRLRAEGYDPAAYGGRVSDPADHVSPPADESPPAALPARAEAWMLPFFPALSEADGAYAAAVFSGPGASLVISDVGGGRSVLAGTARASSAAGRLTHPFPAASPLLFDEASTLRVAFAGGFSPESADYDGWLEGETALMLESGELVFCRSAVLTSDGSVMFKGLVRGACGSEPYVTGLSIGARVLALNAAPVPLNVPSLRPGRQYELRCVPFGAEESACAPTTFTYLPRARLPLRPVRFGASAQASGGVLISWIPCDLSNDWSPTDSAFYAEASIRFRLRVYTLSGTLKREWVTGLTSRIYLAAELAEDAFVTGDTVTFRICALTAGGEESPEATCAYSLP